MEKLYGNCATLEENDLAWIAAVLWKAFPEARSEEHLADLVAEVLTTPSRECNPRTVKNWLRGDNAPHFRYVGRILAMATAESLFAFIGGRE